MISNPVYVITHLELNKITYEMGFPEQVPRLDHNV